MKEIKNMDHPLYRKSTYNPKDPDEICREALRRAMNQAHIRHMDRIWGKGWSDI